MFYITYSTKITKISKTKIKNYLIEKKEFPQNVQLANITPVYKKNYPLGKSNNSPVCVLPVISNIFERIMQKQNNGFSIISFSLNYVVTGKVSIYNKHY